MYYNPRATIKKIKHINLANKIIEKIKIEILK